MNSAIAISDNQHSIQVNPEKFRELLSVQMNPSEPGFNKKLCKFIELLDRIRLAVQSNLGLSAVARDAHESHHSLLIKKGNVDFPVDENGEVSAENVLYDSVQIESTHTKHSPRVVIVKDVSGEDGIIYSL